jgi:hypothetical protein
MQAVTQRAVAGAQAQRTSPSEPQAGQAVIRRLAAEFPMLTPAVVGRCVGQTWRCAEHLGLAVTAGLVERIAREHLLGMVNSVPPSSREPAP